MANFPLITPALLFATPLVVAAMGELVVERSGVVNIGIEGMMLTGAMAGWAVDGWKGPAAGVIAACVAAVILAIPFAVATLVFAADQIVTGTGINLLALGVTGIAYKLVPVEIQDRVVRINTIDMQIAAVVLTAAVWIFLRFTRSGLELIAVGESPLAAESAGVAVRRRRFMAILFGAATAGLAGSYLSIMYNATFNENMTDGRGFLALAIVIFGRWKPVGVIAAGIFFGFASALANHLETIRGIPPTTHRLFDALPYVVSLAALAGVAGKSAAPAALGIPYERSG